MSSCAAVLAHLGVAISTYDCHASTTSQSGQVGSEFVQSEQKPRLEGVKTDDTFSVEALLGGYIRHYVQPRPAR